MKRFTRALLSTAALALAAALPVQAMDVSGTKIEDIATVAGKNLVLNGAGIRYKVVKVYVVGLYLTEKKGDTAGVLATPGPKRFKIVALREISSDEFGQALLTGIKRLLHEEGMTIRGVQKILREQGVRFVSGLADASEEDLHAASEADFIAFLDVGNHAAPGQRPSGLLQ